MAIEKTICAHCLESKECIEVRYPYAKKIIPTKDLYENTDFTFMEMMSFHTIITTICDDCIAAHEIFLEIE